MLLLLTWLCSQLEAQPLSLSMRASVWPGLRHNTAAGPKGKHPKKESGAEAVLPFMTKPGGHLASLLSYLPYTTSQGNHKVLLRLKGRRRRLLMEGRDGKSLEGRGGGEYCGGHLWNIKAGLFLYHTGHVPSQGLAFTFCL